MQAEINMNKCDRCSCCFAEGKHDNCEVVHVKMLRKYLNLIIKWDSITPVICSACVDFLQEVQRFREMVISSQRQLLVAHGHNEAVSETNNQDNFDDTVKVEEEITFDLHSVDSENITLPNVTGHKDETTTEALSPEYLIDWGTLEDTELDGKHEVADTISKSETKRKLNDAKIDLKLRTKFNPESDAKPPTISDITKKTQHPDDKKIRSNMILILKHSTILPFRNNFKCFYCEKLCIKHKELKKHIDTEHNDVSEKTISKIVSSLQDIVVTADTSCIKCKLCKEEFISIENLVEHFCNTHKMTYYNTDKKPSYGILAIDLSSGRLKCHICNKEFNYLKNLSEHINNHYGSIVCYVCGKQFVSEHRYQSHVYRVHTDREFKCKHCGQIFSTESTMVYHIRKVHSKPVIKCVKCPETFPLGHYVKRLYHMAEVHGIKKPVFKCHLCGKEYASSDSLAAHNRYTHKHTTEYKCEVCGYITIRKTVMKIHMEVHSGVKSHECEFCKKKFAKLYTLNVHLKTHLYNNMFVCTLCDDAFLQKLSLIKHYKSRHPHSGIDVNEL